MKGSKKTIAAVLVASCFGPLAYAATGEMPNRTYPDRAPPYSSDRTDTRQRSQGISNEQYDRGSRYYDQRLNSDTPPQRPSTPQPSWCKPGMAC